MHANRCPVACRWVSGGSGGACGVVGRRVTHVFMGIESRRETASWRQESELLLHSLIFLMASNVSPHQYLITVVLECPKVATHFLHELWLKIMSLRLILARDHFGMLLLFLTSIRPARSKETPPALYNFHYSPHSVLINLLIPDIHWRGGLLRGNTLNSFVLTFQYCYS